MRKRKSNLMLRLASLLLACVIISTYALCGLLARYTTTGSGSDSARVINFTDIRITEKGSFVKEISENVYEKVPAYIIPGVNLIKDVEISFDGSEAGTYIFVEMTLKGDWDGPTIKDNVDTYSIGSFMSFGIIHDESNGWKYYPQSEDNKHVYYKELAPNTKIDHEQLTANEGTIIVSSQITRSQLPTLADTEINFRAIAVQANGFENIDAAWNAVK